MTEVLEAIARLERYKQTHRLEYYEPYEYQRNFHNATGFKTEKPARQRALMAANQVGKCVSKQTLITHPDGSATKAGKLYERGQQFSVLAWDGEGLVPAVATAAIKKPPEQIYRLYLSNGQWFECAANHRILTEDGYAFCGQLLASVPVLPASIWECGPLVRAEDVLRLFGKLRGFLSGCLLGFRSCGARLLTYTGSVSAFAPLQDGAPKHTQTWSRKGGLEHICTSNARPFSCRPSSWCAPRQVVALCAESLGRACGTTARLLSDCSRVLRRLSIAGDRQLQPACVEGVCQPLIVEACESKSYVLSKTARASIWGRLAVSLFRCASYLVSKGLESASCSLVDPVKEGNQIIAYKPVGVHEVYDFTVPGLHNYCTAGVVHHNTTCGAYEVAMHLTGKYPKWWQGNQFSYPNEWLVASTTNETTRDRCQKDLFGEPTDDKANGTGAVPLELIGEMARKPGVPNAYDSVLVKHVSGGWSKVVFRAYEQGPKKFMGSRLTGGYWADEEPPGEVHSQMVRGIFATNGIGMITFTPEEGITEVVAQFMNDIQEGQSLIRAKWDDAPHMTPERRAIALAGIPPHERAMRSEGEPLMGSGRVFDIFEESIMCDPFEIPGHFPRLNGLDFGWDHPTAVAFGAVDRESDTVYIYDGWKERRTPIPVVASTIKSRGDWIPVSWPHDGLQHDKQSGKPIAEHYRSHGVNMWPVPFTNPPPPGIEEGKGGNGVEAGIFAMLEMMQTGRFKVFKNVKYWWEEARMYHRKDGKIVAINDDFISAVRYMVMFRRHAQTKLVRQPRLYTAPGVSNWG